MDDLYGMKSATGQMSEVLIRATYIGVEGDLGFKRGQRYMGWMRGNTFYPDQTSGAKPCPYSVAGFLRTFSDIEVQQKRIVNIRRF